MQAEYRTSRASRSSPSKTACACSSAAVWDGSLCLAGPRRRCVPSTSLQDGRIVMRTADPALSAAAAKALAASFEFDEIRNEDHRAWNVIVTGELEALDDAARLDGRGVNAWAPSEGERSIALRIADVSGREVPEPHVPRRSSDSRRPWRSKSRSPTSIPTPMASTCGAGPRERGR